MKDASGKLTVLFLYTTNYFHTNPTEKVQIEFVPGKEIAVNIIIDIPTRKQWKCSIRLEGNFLTSPLLQTKFPLIFKPTNTGLSSSIAFYYNESIQPIEIKSSGQTLVMNMIPDTPNINVNSRVKPPSIFTIQE